MKDMLMFYELHCWVIRLRGQISNQRREFYEKTPLLYPLLSLKYNFQILKACKRIMNL